MQQRDEEDVQYGVLAGPLAVFRMLTSVETGQQHYDNFVVFATEVMHALSRPPLEFAIRQRCPEEWRRYTVFVTTTPKGVEQVVRKERTAPIRKKERRAKNSWRLQNRVQCKQGNWRKKWR